MSDKKTLETILKRISSRISQKRPWLKKVELKLEHNEKGVITGKLTASSPYKKYEVNCENRCTESLTSSLLKKILRTTREEKKKRITLARYLEVA